MGDVYILRRGFKAGEGAVKELVVPSEALGMPSESKDEAVRMVNGNTGIFFYERSLWYPEKLKKDLIKIVQHIDKLEIPPMFIPSGRVVQPKAPRRRGKIKLVYEEGAK